MTQRVDSPLLSYQTPGPPRRPASVLVFGIIGIVIASLALLRIVLFIVGALMSGIYSSSSFAFLSVAASLTFHIALLWISIGLIRMWPAARRNAVRWAVAYIAWTLVEMILFGWWMSITSGEYSLEHSLARAGRRIVRILPGMAVVCIYPTLLIIFMRRRHVRDAFGREVVQPIPVAALAEPDATATSTVPQRSEN
jgi:hypothetical protein